MAYQRKVIERVNEENLKEIIKKLNDKGKHSDKSKLKFKMDLEKRMAEISQQAEKLKMELNKVEEEWSTFNI